jgi:hypothetical protein
MVGKRFPPVEGDTVPIYFYRPGEWQRESISTEPRGVLRAINPVTSRVAAGYPANNRRGHTNFALIAGRMSPR